MATLPAQSTAQNEDSSTLMTAPDTEVDARQTFGVDIDLKIPAFSQADERVPDMDPDYVFDPDTTMAILAGFAFTKTSFPKAIRFPAFVAGFFFSLIIVTPGIVNFPEDFSAPGMMPSSASITAFTSFDFTPDLASIAFAISLFDMDLVESSGEVNVM